VRVAVADDSALIRDGLARLLPEHGFEVVATCSDGPELFRAVEESAPDVALIDIRMPPTFSNEGIAAATTIRALHPGTAVLVLSQYVEVDYALDLIKTNPDRCGYLLKDRITDTDILADAIRRVGRGECCIDSEMVDLLLRKPATRSRLAQLTPRELEVLGLVAQGLTDRGISDRLWLNPKTVETHVRHILAKLTVPGDTSHNRRVLAVLTYLREAPPLNAW
jgi:DNA-binding NarL/FixJ family response regulator